MINSMKALLLSGVLFALCSPALAFTTFTATSSALLASNFITSNIMPKQQQQQQRKQGLVLFQHSSNDDSEMKNFLTTKLTLTTAAVTTTIMTFFYYPLVAMADDVEYEAVGLPPPYVPALFGVALLGGVALLTGSLGNVMDEEASLGMQSGARAKKEIERSRSSYFKKK